MQQASTGAEPATMHIERDLSGRHDRLSKVQRPRYCHEAYDLGQRVPGHSPQPGAMVSKNAARYHASQHNPGTSCTDTRETALDGWAWPCRTWSLLLRMCFSTRCIFAISSPWLEDVFSGSGGGGTVDPATLYLHP